MTNAEQEQSSGGPVLRLFDVKGMGGARPDGSEVKVTGVATDNVAITTRGAKIPKGATITLAVTGTVVSVGHTDVFAMENGERVRVGTTRVHAVKCDDAVVTSWRDDDGGLMFDGVHLRSTGAVIESVDVVPAPAPPVAESAPVDESDPEPADFAPEPEQVEAEQLAEPALLDPDPTAAPRRRKPTKADIDNATEDELLDILRACGVPNPPRVGVDTIRQMCRTVT